MEVKTDSNEYWEYFRASLDANIGDATGKYLFFSRDRDALRKIAQEEIGNHGFVTAKVNAPDDRKTDHVLCLYWKDNSRLDELRHRHVEFNVSFPGWKSNEDTRKGVYSEKFKKENPKIAKKLGLTQ